MEAIHITVVEEKVEEMISGKTTLLDNDIPMVPAGAVVHHNVFGDGQDLPYPSAFSDGTMSVD